MILTPLTINFASLRHSEDVSSKPSPFAVWTRHYLPRGQCRTNHASSYVCATHIFYSGKDEIIARDLRREDMSSPPPSAVSRLMSNSAELQLFGIHRLEDSPS